MNNFKALLSAHVVAAFIISVVLLTLITNFGKQQLLQNQQQTQTLLQSSLATKYDTQMLTTANQVASQVPFNLLQISSADGDLLVNFNNSQQQQQQMFDGLFLPANPVTQFQITNAEQQSLRVRFELDQHASLSQLNLLIWFSIVLPFALTLLPLLVTKFNQQRFVKQNNDAMVSAIETMIVANDKQKTAIQVSPEFTDVASALKKLAEHTRQQVMEVTNQARHIADEAYKDQVTGLPNRNRFVQFYEELSAASDPSDFGIFAITRCTELQSLNQSRGFQEGDQYVIQVVDIIKKVSSAYRDTKLFRLNSSDFAILLPRVTPKESENFALQLQSRFNEFQKLAELDSVAYTGLVAYEKGKALGELLATADTSISLAQTKQSNAWHLQKETNGLENASNSYGNQNWRNVIEDVITHNRISLLVQSIQPSSRSAKAYSEILVRFRTHEDQILPTASFLAMAEKLDKIIAVDRMIIETALTTIKDQNMQDQYFGINLTARSVHDDQFVIWLERRLLKDANIAAKLVFEVSEFGLQQNLKTSKRFIDMVHRAGARITVEKFGVGITSFKFFRDLKPDYVKMDGSYTRQIDTDKNNQYFMRLIIDLAHRIGVGVFAECVETQEEKHMLESLFIDGNQGYYIAKPTPI